MRRRAFEHTLILNFMKLFLICLVIFFGFILNEASAKNYYDLNLVDLEILGFEAIPIEENPNYPFFPSDIVKVKFKVTKMEPGLFILSDRMFKLHSLTPSFVGDPVLQEFRGQEISFKAVYESNLEVRYKGFDSQNYFDNCEYFHEVLLDGDTKTKTVCFDVLRRLNIIPVNFEDTKQYSLVLMDNKQSNSCPNCVEFVLSTEKSEPLYLPKTTIEISSENNYCREGFELILKPVSQKPVCVYTETAKILILRGWISENE